MNHTRAWASTLALLLIGAATATRAGQPEDDRWGGMKRELASYRLGLDAVRGENGGVRKLPPVTFFIFGMGHRQKFVYRQGVLRDARTGRVVRRWGIDQELIVPPAYTVALQTKDGDRVFLVEDQEAVWLEEGGRRIALTRGHVSLPNIEAIRGGPSHRGPQRLRPASGLPDQTRRVDLPSDPGGVSHGSP